MRVLTSPLANQVARIAAAHGRQAAVDELAEKIDDELARPSKELHRILHVLGEREAMLGLLADDLSQRDLLRARITGLMEAVAIVEDRNPPMPVQRDTTWPLHFPD